eukprot:g16668.t1
MSNHIRVASYNVLSPALSNPNSHIRCDPDNLHPATRLAKIKEKLRKEVVSSRSIICLQEVGLSWKGELHQFFDDHDYKVVDSHYGNQHNDFMGVLIAYPDRVYKVSEISVQRLSDTFVDFSLLPEPLSFAERLAQKDKERLAAGGGASASSSGSSGKQDLADVAIKDLVFQLVRSVVRKISGIDLVLTSSSSEKSKQPLTGNSAATSSTGTPVVPVPGSGDQGGLTPSSPSETAWDIVEKRQNRVIMARFHLKTNPDNEFAVATYHNPCLFGAPEKVRALGIHTAMLVQAFQEFAGVSTPRILAGDFNFTPTNSPIYSLVTTQSDELLKRMRIANTTTPIAANAPMLQASLAQAASDLTGGGRLISSGEQLEYDVPEKYQSLWRPQDNHPLDSAYAMAKGSHGKEPRFTNYASRKSEYEESDFMETLDYIFLSKSHWEVQRVLKLPEEREAYEAGVCPNEYEPSDHLLIAATLTCRKFGLGAGAAR